MTSEMLTQVFISMAENGITDDIDASIEHVRTQYYEIKNSYFRAAEQRMEQMIFRLYDCKYFVHSGMNIDVKKYAVDDEYFKAQQPVIAEAHDLAAAQPIFQQAVALADAKDYAAAGPFYLKAALLGHVGAQYNYGITLANGEGCDVNLTESCYWYWKAACRNHPKAMVNLAIAYRRGDGVKEELGQMLYLYARAAEQLIPEAVYFMGLSLKNEEVFSGLAEVGLELIGHSDHLDQPETASRVQGLARAIIRTLLEHTDIYTI